MILPSRIGITGTRRGATRCQEEVLRTLLFTYAKEVTEFHHGCCIGVDAMFHRIVLKMFPETPIIVHPPIEDEYRASVEVTKSVRFWAPESYLYRNHHIVAESDWLIALPYQAKEYLRSGTWATVRRARNLRKMHTVILPSGNYVTFNEGKSTL